MNKIASWRAWRSNRKRRPPLKRSADRIDFELRIESSWSGFRAKARGAEGVVFSAPFSPQELDSFRVWLASMGRGDRNFEVEPPSGDAGREIGAKLFTAVFAEGVLAAYRDARNKALFLWSRLRIRLIFEDAEVAVWPWEFLFDPDRGEFVFRSERRSLIRTLDVPNERRPVVVDGPLRMLVVRSGPRDLQRLDLDEEVLAIEAELAKLSATGRLQIETLDRPSLSKVFDRLHDNAYHIVHFMGHGVFSEDEGGSVLLEDGDGAGVAVDHDLLGEFLQHETLRLVVLNVCEGGRTCPESPFSGVAQHLVKAGVPAVIAMQCLVQDKMAISFARYFYGALARTGRIGQALAHSRKQLLAEGYRYSWGIPVLYMQSDDGMLFDVTTAATWMKLGAAIAAFGLAIYVGLHEGIPCLNKHPSLPPPPPVPPSAECPSPAGLKMVFVNIPAGNFSMGSKHGDDANKPPHNVIISKPFCLGAYEVTQGQYKAMMNSNPSRTNGDNLPVENVAWEDAQEFLRQLRKADPAGGYRLPTEAEWEYAARGGKPGVFGFGGEERTLWRYGNCTGKADSHEEPVGRFQATAWNLHDMHGNVSEWVEDWFGLYDAKPVTDPTGPPEGTERVRRGGSFRNSASSCNAVLRKHSQPDQPLYDVGFRVVRDPIRLP